MPAGTRWGVGVGVLALLAAAVAAVVALRDDPAGTPGPAVTGTPTPAGGVRCEEPGRTPEPPAPTTVGYCSAPPVIIDQSRVYRATLVTTAGDIRVRLRDDAAPLAVNNLVYLARDGYYEGVPFHRVVEGFVIQTGDPTGTGTGCVDPGAPGGGDCELRLPGYRFPDELGLAERLVSRTGGYPRGTVAMANSGPDTNGSQFFIVQGRAVDLPPRYTVFGEVTAGMDVVDAIASGPQGEAITADPVRLRDIMIRVARATGPPTPT